MLFAVVLLAVPAVISGQQASLPQQEKPGAEKPAAEKPAVEKLAASKTRDAAVQTQMRNVRYRFTGNVAVEIKTLSGALVPTAGHDFPVMDDKNSFKIRIDSGEVVILPADLANMLNSYVFARPGAPLGRISASIEKGQLKVKGRLRDKGDIPFETIGKLSATPDGKVRLHTEKVKALKIPVKGLLDAFGIEIDDLIKNGKVPGVAAEENDLILDLQQVLPPPHIQSAVTAIRIEGDGILTTFGNSPATKSGDKPAGKATSGNFMSYNFMSYKGNRLQAGKLIMDDTDFTVIDMDPADPLDFYLDHYKDQLAAGYTKTSPTLQLRIYLKDYDKIGKTPAAKSKTRGSN
jgi:hypothetical protein